MVKTVGKIRWRSVEEFADLHTRRGAVQDECGSVVVVVVVVSSLSVKIVNPWSISSVPMMIFIHILLDIFTSYYKTMGNACSMQIHANEDHFSNHHYNIIDISFNYQCLSLFQSPLRPISNHINFNHDQFDQRLRSIIIIIIWIGLNLPSLKTPIRVWMFQMNH